MRSGETVLDKISRECLIRKNLKEIPFIHYFSNEFMERNTQYFCIEDFMKTIGIFDTDSLKDVNKDDWDDIVNRTTVFKDWDDMLNNAGSEYYQLHMQRGFAI